MKRLTILGSTGSIGVNALNVVRNLDENFSIKYLTANSNSELLIEQAIEFRPETVVIVNKEKANIVKESLENPKVKNTSNNTRFPVMLCFLSVDLV